MSASAVNLRVKRGLFVLPHMTDPKLEELPAWFFLHQSREVSEKNLFFPPKVKLGEVCPRCSRSVASSKRLLQSWWVGSRQRGAWTGRIVSAGGSSPPCGSREIGQETGFLIGFHGFSTPASHHEAWTRVQPAAGNQQLICICLWTFTASTSQITSLSFL